jgi:hypothetical protein
MMNGFEETNKKKNKNEGKSIFSCFVCPLVLMEESRLVVVACNRWKSS